MPADLRAADFAGYRPGTWDIGPGSSLEFSVQHMLVSRTRGRFTDFHAVVVTTEDPALCSVEASIAMPSFTTNDSARDEATLGPDWLDAAAYPTATYRSTSVRADGAGKVVALGELTLHGVTRPVDLHIRPGGFVELPSGRTVAGFSAHAEIERKDFGIGSRVLMATGGLMVGEKISIDLEIEAVLRKENS